MTAALLVLGALAAGLGACSLLGVSDRAARGALVPGLGGALALGSALLAETAAPALQAPQIAGGALILLGLGALAARRGARCEPPGSEREAAPAGLGTWAALLLLAGAAWLFPVGSMHLDPGYDFLVCEAPLAVQVADHGDAARHPLGPEAAPPRPALARLLGALGGDPLFTASALAGLAQVLAFLAFYGGLRAATGHSMAALLGAGAAFMGTPDAWLATAGPAPALAHLFGAAAVAAAVAGRGAAVGGLAALLLAAAALVEPAFPLPLAALVALAALIPTPGGGRLQGRTQLLLAGAATLAALALGARPAPPAPEATLWTWWLLPAAAVAWRMGMRAALVLAAGEVCAWALGGSQAGGSVFAAGAVFTVLGELLARAWQASRPGRWRLSIREGLTVGLPWRALVAAAVLFLVVQGLEPAETALNRRVLLAGQKAGVPVQRLLVPGDLEDWVAHQGANRGLAEGDLVLARDLAAAEGDVLFVAPRADRRSLEAAAVLATLSRRPLLGWHADPRAPEFHPEAATLARDLPGLVVSVPNVLARGSFHGMDLRVLMPVPPVPAPEGDPPATLALLEGSPAAPGQVLRLVPVSPVQRVRLGYRAFRDGAPWGGPVEFQPGSALLFPFPRTEGSYRLQFFARSGEREIPLGDGRLEAFTSAGEAALAALRGRAEGLPSRLPSRTLVPFELVLVNSGSGPLDLDRLEGLRIMVEGREAAEEEKEGRLQPLAETGILKPGRSVRIGTWLPTPLAEGTFRARVILVGPDDMQVDLPLEPPLEFRTWRRIPAGGAW